MSKITNDGLHYSCIHMAAVGVKVLRRWHTSPLWCCWCLLEAVCMCCRALAVLPGVWHRKNEWNAWSVACSWHSTDNVRPSLSLFCRIMYSCTLLRRDVNQSEAKVVAEAEIKLWGRSQLLWGQCQRWRRSYKNSVYERLRSNIKFINTKKSHPVWQSQQCQCSVQKSTQ